MVFRYYDSSGIDVLSPGCHAKAELLVRAVRQHGPEYMPGFKFPTEMPPRTNTRSRQENGIDCGIFVGHFWEGEVRRLLGQGWAIDYPSQSVIYKMRFRLVRFITQLRQIHEDEEKKKVKMAEAAAAKAAAKKGAGASKNSKGAPTSAAAPADPELSPEERAQRCLLFKNSMELSLQLQVSALADLAKLQMAQGSVPFYGCSKCRWSRGGCIWWKCNPDKFQKHYDKFPEKYQPGSKELLPKAVEELTFAEFQDK